MSILQVFNFDLTTAIRTALVSETVWFVAKDLADALEYSQTQKALELCKNANSPSNSELNKINQLPPATKWIPESDMYRLIMRSNKPEAEKFQDWVCEEVLPTIRKTGKFEASSSSVKEKIEIDLMFADFVVKTLNLPDSGKLSILGKIERAHGITSFLPSYAIDAPTTSGSSLVTFAASTLLKENGSPMSTQKFNILSESKGFIIELERPSTTKGTKKFKSLTEKGLKFGKNLTSPQNPRETTPHYYSETFNELLEALC